MGPQKPDLHGFCGQGMNDLLTLLQGTGLELSWILEECKPMFELNNC